MADPQFEQFRETFDKLPQHIRAPTYSYRLTHDITPDLSTPDNGNDWNNTTESEDNNPGLYGKRVKQEDCGQFMPLFPKNDVTILPNARIHSKWIEHCSKEMFTLPQWSNTNEVAARSVATVAGERQRRKLPEIPKNKIPVGTSIMFKTQAPSLADELIEADKLNPLGLNPSMDLVEKSNRCLAATRRRLPNYPRTNPNHEKTSSPEDKIINTDFDSGVSNSHSPVCAKRRYSTFNGTGIYSPVNSPASSSGISTSTIESLEATHRGLHKFFPRHLGEMEVEIGDPLYIQREADDLWCEGINLRTGKSGIIPSAYVTDVEYTEFDPECIQVQRERFVLKFLGSIEVTCHKGSDVLCQAVRKITDAEESCGHYPHMCTLEISDQGLRMVDKGKPAPNHVPCHDYFFNLKNISFCGFHPQDNRYFGFITKHPTMQRFACHVFIGDESTRPVAESVGRAFERFYQKFMETVYPIEDMYLE